MPKEKEIMATESVEKAGGQTRIGIYARHSTNKQDLERQHKELAKFLCDPKNTLPDGRPKYVVWNGKEYQDQAKTGRTFQRKDLERALADAKMGRFEILVVWGLSRLGRNLKESINYIGQLEDAGVDVWDTQMNLRYSNSRDRIIMHQRAAFHDHQWTEMVRNTQEKMDIITDELAKHGCRLGSPSILDVWVESPRKTRADKQGLAVKPCEKKTQKFKDFWNDGITVRRMAEFFRNDINPKCRHCGGKPPKDYEMEKITAQRCKCGRPCSEKTIHVTRKKLGLPKRNPHSFISKDEVEKDESLVKDWSDFAGDSAVES